MPHWAAAVPANRLDTIGLLFVCKSVTPAKAIKAAAKTVRMRNDFQRITETSPRAYPEGIPRFTRWSSQQGCGSRKLYLAPAEAPSTPLPPWRFCPDSAHRRRQGSGGPSRDPKHRKNLFMNGCCEPDRSPTLIDRDQRSGTHTVAYRTRASSPRPMPPSIIRPASGRQATRAPGQPARSSTPIEHSVIIAARSGYSRPHFLRRLEARELSAATSPKPSSGRCSPEPGSRLRLRRRKPAELDGSPAARSGRSWFVLARCTPAPAAPFCNPDARFSKRW